MTTHDKLNGIFQDFFEQDDLTISRDTTASDISGWDSLAHINLIMTVENEFGIKFAIGELQSLQNVGQMLDLIKKKTA